MKSKINVIFLAIIFSVILVGCVSAVYDDWDYKTSINVTENSGSNLTDYQILLTVDTASLISEGKMQADCDDIRFTDSDETTELSYWLESGCNTTNTNVWVKVPDIFAGGTKTIYTYYGNSSAINESNFSSISQDFWINQTGYSATPSIQTPYNFIVESDRALWGGGQWNAGYNGIRFNYTNTQDKFTINFTTKFTLFNHPTESYLDRSIFFFDAYTSDNNGIFTMFRKSNTMYIYDGPSWTWITLRNTAYSKNIGSMNTGTEYNIGIDFNGTTWRVYVDGTLKRTITQATYKNSPVGWVRITGRHTTNSYGTTDTENQITLYSDSFYQNQYASSEPTYTIGSEQQNVGGTDPTYSNFTASETTDFSTSDVTNVTNLTLAVTGSGKIKFPQNHSINAVDEDYNTHVKIENSLIFVNSSALDNTFNNSATLTFEGVNCNAPYVYYSEIASTRTAILAENNLCLSPRCTNIHCTGSILTVDVTHFSGYAVNGTANLTIDADDPKYPLEVVIFTAEYMNSTGLITGATCNISFTDGSYIMDEQVDHYNYTRIFASEQIAEYNVTCSKSGENTVFANDTAVIQSTEIPEFSTITLGLGLIAVLAGLFVIRNKK